MLKSKQPVYSVPETYVKKLNGCCHMKKRPKNITFRFAFRPWETMEMAVWVVYGKSYHSEIMHFVPVVEQGVDSSEQPLAEPTLFGPVITGENSEFAFFTGHREIPVFFLFSTTGKYKLTIGDSHDRGLPACAVLISSRLWAYLKFRY